MLFPDNHFILLEHEHTEPTKSVMSCGTIMVAYDVLWKLILICFWFALALCCTLIMPHLHSSLFYRYKICQCNVERNKNQFKKRFVNAIYMSTVIHPALFLLLCVSLFSHFYCGIVEREYMKKSAIPLLLIYCQTSNCFLQFY